MSELTRNQVLAQLPQRSRDAIGPLLRRDELAPWQLLADENERIARVYFPIDAVISIVTPMKDGSIAESYTAGRDGIAGWEVLRGEERTIFRFMCQVPGVAYSLDARQFCDIVAADAQWLAVTFAYAHCVMGFTGRSAACNLLHQVVERCARWLLITHDRVEKNTFELTHEILSTMLGVHRPAVSIAAGALQRAGLIAYTRGRITIVDRAGLEAASCECYRVVADEYVRVLGGPVPPSVP